MSPARTRSVVRRARDGSIVHQDGRILFFSIPRFIKEVCAGIKCFICNADPATTEFNDEHILPDWLLRRFDLHNRRITLPNLSGYRYGQYKVPCCERCNQRMGRLIETPLSQIFAGGIESVQSHLVSHGPLLLYTWLALIFLKTHLRDRTFREHLDRRKGDGYIGDRYEWEGLHHIHCLARSFHTGATLGPGVIGSLAVIQARVHPQEERFDYADLYAARTILVRINDVCVIAVLNDAGAGMSYVYENDFAKLKGALTALQLRELMARFALINLKLRETPRFMTGVNDAGAVRLMAQLPDGPPRIYKIRRSEFGRVLYGASMPAVQTIRDRHGKLLGSRVRKGFISFLFDDRGRFIEEPIAPMAKAEERPVAKTRSRRAPRSKRRSA